MVNKQTGKVTIGGLVLAILAAILFPRGLDDPATNGGGGAPTVDTPAVTPAPATRADTPAPVIDATSPTRTTPKAATPAPSGLPGATSTAPTQTKPKASQPPATGPPPSTSRVGWTSRASLESHFDKHGAEFGRITIDDYLAAAKALRDAPLSTDVLEITRTDGVITRFDRRTGNFVAFHDDKTIRTLFRPNDGEAYFRRQGQR